MGEPKAAESSETTLTTITTIEGGELQTKENFLMKGIRKLRLHYIKVTLICLTLVIIVGFAVLILKLNKPVTIPRREITKPNTTTTAKSTATVEMTTEKYFTPVERFLAEIDYAFDPCEDFYQFICRKWKKKNPTMKTTLSNMKKDTDEVLKRYFQTNKGKLLPDYYKKMRQFYFTCYNYSNKYRDVERSIVFNIFQKLPSRLADVSLKQKSDKYDINEFLRKIRKEGLGFLIFFEATAVLYAKNKIFIDSTNRVRMIKLKKPGFVVTKDKERNIDPDEVYPTSEENTGQKIYYERYTKEAKHKMEILHLKVTSDADKILQEIFKFETALYIFSKGESPEYITLKDLIGTCPLIAWIEYFGGISSGLKIKEDQIVEVFNLKYFKKLNELISKFDSKVITDYIYVKAATEMYDLINISNDQCLELLKHYTPAELSSTYMKARNISDDAKQIFEYIQNALMIRLKEIDWMSSNTGGVAIGKINSTKSGDFPFDRSFDEFPGNRTVLSNFVNFVENNFLQNILNMRIHYDMYEFEKLEISFEPFSYTWENYVTYKLEEAEYGYIFNGIVIATEMLQEPVYDPNRPNSMNFATIGFVIARQLMHAIAGLGSGFDEKGNENEWWDLQTSGNFRKSVMSCITGQYNKFYHPKHLPLPDIDNATKMEIYFDVSALILAKDAYNNWKTDEEVKEKQIKDTIPGYNYDGEHIFWISFARIWCSQVDTEFWNENLKRNLAPPIYKIMGTLQNIHDFSLTFKCIEASTMNNEETSCDSSVF